MTELPFERIGSYELVRKLGVGGMGEVYLARDSRLEREVAVKLLPVEFSRDPDSLERFRHEALTLASLNHPGVGTIYAFEETPDGGLALILEYVPGDSLASRLEKGPMPVTEALTVCAQIAEALEVAHERGVVHRDLKPGNVMFGQRGLVKVLDFGLAKHTGGLVGIRQKALARAAAAASGRVEAPTTDVPNLVPQTGGAITLAGVILGTPGYMSPEQVLAGEQDERSDVFAFGCVLYECVTGRRAFEGRDHWEIFAKILNDTPDAAGLERLAPRARALLDRCLAKDVEQRLRSMREARFEIEEALGTRRAAALREGERAEIPHNLPRQLSSFVGRESELERCQAELGKARLLTLLGMGGSGKTRLALRLAEGVLNEHPDGVWFADLSVLSSGERVVETVASAVGAREEPGKPLEQTLAEHLGDRRVLLLFDNCEDVLAGCRELVTRLLSSCPGVRLLATSREALGVSGEVLHTVPPLGIPDAGGASAADSEAVRLFAERASLVRPDFAIGPENLGPVAEICRRLDGIPLALELAAARVRMLGVDQILARLDDRFRLLTAGRDTEGRHQTLRAVIQWSADQLAEEELRLFRALSVFVGFWSLESATAVSGDDMDEFEVLDALQRLADKSLVMLSRDADGDARYRYLESVRHLALEQLAAAGEADACRDRHLDWFVGVAEKGEPQLTGAGQKKWLPRLDLEQEDVLAAHAWSAGRPGGAVKGLSMAAAMARYWSMRGHVRLGRRILTESLQQVGDLPPSPAQAMAGVRAASFALQEGDYDGARPLLERSLEIYREAGDEKGVARALIGLGTAAIFQQDYLKGRAYCEESVALYRRQGNHHAIATGLHNLAYVAMRLGDPASARTQYEEVVSLFEGSGDDRLRALALGELGLACARLGDEAAARSHLATALRLATSLGAQREAGYALESTAELAGNRGQAAQALGWLGAAAALRERLGTPLFPAEGAEQDALRARLGQALPREEAEAAVGGGRAMALSQAVEAALGWLET
jgi:non-specific serine/threonine protein kinase